MNVGTAAFVVEDYDFSSRHGYEMRRGRADDSRLPFFQACSSFLPSLCWSMALLGIFMMIGALFMGNLCGSQRILPVGAVASVISKAAGFHT